MAPEASFFVHHQGISHTSAKSAARVARKATQLLLPTSVRSSMACRRDASEFISVHLTIQQNHGRGSDDGFVGCALLPRVCRCLNAAMDHVLGTKSSLVGRIQAVPSQRGNVPGRTHYLRRCIKQCPSRPTGTPNEHMACQQRCSLLPGYIWLADGLVGRSREHEQQIA